MNHNDKNSTTSPIHENDAFTRRDVLLGASAAIGASLLPQSAALAQADSSSPVTTVFTNTTVVTNDSERRTLRSVYLLPQ